MDEEKTIIEEQEDNSGDEKSGLTGEETIVETKEQETLDALDSVDAVDTMDAEDAKADPDIVNPQVTDDVVPPGDEPVTTKKRPWGIYIIIALLVVALGVMGYLLFLKEKPLDEESAQIRQMQQLAGKIQGMETDVKTKQDEVLTLMDEYKQKTGKPFLGVNPLNLNEEEQTLLDQKIKDEKDVSIKSLLEEINDKNSDIKELQTKIKEIEALLPVPHVVKRGENHYQVAMAFLLNDKKIEKKRALELVERTALFDALVPGFKVYNFYNGTDYGSSVTQGTAAISPNTLIRRAKKQLVDAKDEAISQRDKLSEDIEVLEEKRNEIIKQVDSLTNEKANLVNKVSELNVHVNSLFYMQDSQRNLKKKGILKGGFLKSTKLRDVSPENFTMSVDLRAGAEIAVSAADVGMSKIKGITLFPKFYKKGTAYKVAIDADKQNAVVTLLDIEKFKNERIVISVK
ncbi:MAG: hypothetical protein GY950_26805 [bacterium]|nr:hypothetical protein [bacterium]